MQGRWKAKQKKKRKMNKQNPNLHYNAARAAVLDTNWHDVSTVYGSRLVELLMLSFMLSLLQFQITGSSS